MQANKKHLIGRTIVDVDFRPFPDGQGRTAHNPILTLDNGRKVWFVTEETDVGEYGVTVCISAAPAKKAATSTVGWRQTQ